MLRLFTFQNLGPQLRTRLPINNVMFMFRENSTVAAEEIEKFESIASSWWNPMGEFKPLHSMNLLRVQFVRDGLWNNKQIDTIKSAAPLQGISLMDVGCGGGILSEPLGRLGAKVMGIDAGQQNINVALNHLPENLRDQVTYQCTTIEDFQQNNPNQQFDAVVISEVIEHVQQPDLFLKVASDLVKPNGSMFLTTINRTSLSWVGAIILAENVCRLLPPGTHEWKKFVTPEELQSLLTERQVIKD